MLSLRASGVKQFLGCLVPISSANSVPPRQITQSRTRTQSFQWRMISPDTLGREPGISGTTYTWRE